jgi:hypothetical protein
MDAPVGIDNDHFAGIGMLDLTRERLRQLIASGSADLDAPADVIKIDHRNRQCAGQRHRVADVDGRMERRQRVLAAEAAQQRLGRRALLRRLEPQLAERAAPCLDLGQIGLAGRRQAGAGARELVGGR